MKKAILVVSFGTSYIDTLKVTIEKAENQIRDYFNDYDTYRAFTSHKIIKKLKEKYEMFIDTPEEMLEKLYEQGYDEVIMQPLHIIPGEEFIYINKIGELYKDKF
ncbi:MAG: sirohydrochlorin cobaltochelatase, partial [Clostridium celatum]|nr:sirohydrochlorin cobaltochelatase [Clostridium celatum]